MNIFYFLDHAELMLGPGERNEKREMGGVDAFVHACTHVCLTLCFTAPTETVDTVVIVILLVLARISGLKQSV